MSIVLYQLVSTEAPSVDGTGCDGVDQGIDADWALRKEIERFA